MSKIAFVVCGNGYGHLRRVTEVITELNAVSKRLEILILGASHHEKMLRAWKWRPTGNSNRIEFVSAGLEKNLTTAITDDYNLEDYQRSLRSVFSKLKKFRPEKIVSDNLVGILQEFPSGILMGSFLWSDCLLYSHPGVRSVSEISKFESGLLKRIKPSMLGLEDMAMPEVRKKTSFKGLPWFCKRKDVKEPGRKHNTRLSVLVTGGGTGNALVQLIDIVNHLIERRDVQIFVDKLLYSNFQKSARQIYLFDFEESSFEAIDFIICRPGIGILTDAVKYCIPVCTVTDHDKEIIFNAQRVQELGIGIRLNSRFKGSIAKFISSPRYEWTDKIAGLATGGAKMMAETLLG